MTGERRRRLRAVGARVSGVAAVLAACGALGLAFIPAATAKRASKKSTITTSIVSQEGAEAAPVEAGVPEQVSAPAETAAATGSSAPVPAPSSRRAPARRRADAPTGAAKGSARAPSARTEAAGAGSPTAGSRRAGERESVEPSPPKRGVRSSTGSGQTRGAAQPAAVTKPAASSVRASAVTPAQSPARKATRERHLEAVKERRRLREAEKETKETGTHGKEGSTAPPAPPKQVKPVPPVPARPPAGTPVAMPFSATAASLAPATANAGGSVPAAGSTPAGPAHAPKLASREPRAARRAAHRASDPPALAQAAGAPALAGSFAAAPAGRARPAAPRTSHRLPPAGRPSPLVTTITKIVDVVPTAVRLLIAGLLALALLLGARSRVAALRARRLERQREQLLEDVGLLQAALLPVVPERLGPVGTSVAYLPAAGPGAGGDFYDVFALEDGKLAVVVGDVSGHGRQALPHTALVRFTLRAYLEAGLSPRDALQTAGAVLERQLGGVFATVVLATYEPRERVLVYSCAGHPPPIVLGPQPGAGSIAPVTVCASPPIGIGMPTGTRQTVMLIPGSAQICFYTDGVTEARVGAELFGTTRLVDTLTELGSQASASALLAQVTQQADARPDDMAACVLSVAGSEETPKVLVEELELDRDEAASERTERFLGACGVERGEVAEVIQSARVAAGRAGTVVLEAHRGNGSPHVALRRDHLAYLHARRVERGVAR
jgi:serine phosphatase RsbU (regulator of sigma subunit)